MVPEKRENTPVFQKSRGKQQGGADVGWLSVSSLECGFLADRTSKSCFEGSPGHPCHSRQWGRSGVFCIGISGLGECGARDIGAGAGDGQQYRHATRGVTLEIPAGSVKENEMPANAARRESLEETGYARRAINLRDEPHTHRVR